ncbi:MAG: chromosome segregation protein SMC [Acidimicrobiales bacterium]
MFLKSLTLKGFKSFAETTTLEFEPGITVVVGPNGSGKSNIVDAVAWVLGAQGPRTLRSGKMEDVIFAGTAKRPALGRAEVTLTIDNSAGLIPIEFSEVTITRTLWRSGESEYALNGAPCRLLDIQELLSDSGVGRQQHVIVGQGQIDAVLNAQPMDRRLIVEEAAGVLKYRRRREKAQRRLDATEGNLLRVQDLLREVRRQLRPLERQADAARRHGDVVTELAALRLHLAGRELAALRARASSISRLRDDQVTAERGHVSRLAGLDADVLGAEAALTAVEEDDDRRSRRDRLADDVARAEALRERARGLGALIAERHRSLERLQAMEVDADLVASLEAEAADLTTELTAVDGATASLVPTIAALTADEEALATEIAAVGAPDDSTAQGERPDGPRAAGAAEVRGELAALGAAVDRGVAERDRLSERHVALTSKVQRLTGEAAALGAEQASADEQIEALTHAAEQAVTVRADGDGALEAAEHELTAASGRHGSWTARAEALALALDEARARAGAERLADLDGIVGTLLDVVEIDSGWEDAFAAAAGEAIAAVLVDGVETARRALTRLRNDGASGAVLALALPAAVSDPPRIDGTERVLDHVRSSDADVQALLRRLLAWSVSARVEDALDIAVTHPAVTVVTRSGDRFGASGWRTGSGSAGATGAALEEARVAASTAQAELAAAERVRDRARGVAADARSAETAAGRVLDARLARRAQAASELQRAEHERREAEAEAALTATHVAELDVRLAHDRARAAELAAALPALEAEEAAGLARAAARGRIEQRAAELRARRTDLEIRTAGHDERRSILGRRLSEIETRLGHHRSGRVDAERRRTELAGQLVALQRLGAHLTTVATAVDDVLAHLREQRREHAARTAELTQRLDDLRRQRSVAERELTATREHLQRAELDDAEVRVRIEAATESCRRELDCEPDVAIAATCPTLPPGTTAEHRARELERDVRLMGPINPLALEEHAALLERHGFLEGQLEDVKAGRRELSKVIRAIDAEIVDVFSAAYADVADNFARLFSTLFPGGTGRLRLTDPDNLLETGIDMEARPSGKNIKRLSLLSGGERSLTAMAFLFAVFRSRPSPFYLMDEVEAALDDVNLHRFLDLLREFRSEAQLLIVSHQKRTMESADSLYGVTMQPGGSSKVISERVGAGA